MQPSKVLTGLFTALAMGAGLALVAVSPASSTGAATAVAPASGSSADPHPADGGYEVITEPAPETDLLRSLEKEARAALTVAPEAAADADALTLHSRPGAPYTLLLDLDGQYVADTAWNERSALPAVVHEAWDPRRNGHSFDAQELAWIREIWERVAEDYAPFDVDVTTEDPGQAALDRQGPDDEEYGARVLITTSAVAREALCDGSCGGISYLDTFDDTDNTRRISWVFPQALGHLPKSIADAASHEAGHQFGLGHDGRGGRPYYSGQGGWAPLMGSPYGNPITQFSNGDYSGSTNTEDDLAILGEVLGWRADEAPTGVPTGDHPEVVPLGDGAGVIGSAADADVYALGTCHGTITVTASPATTGPNLDIGLTLLDAAGNVRAAADPQVVKKSRNEALGLDASLRFSGAGDSWFIRIEGVANGSWISGYSDYGSVGAYRITRTGHCLDEDGTTTGEPGTAYSSISLSVPSRVANGRSPRALVLVSREVDGPDSPAEGAVEFTVGGHTASATLTNGHTIHRLPKMTRDGDVVITVSYPGDATTRASVAQAVVTVFSKRGRRKK